MMKKNDFHDKLFRVSMISFVVGMVALSVITLGFVLSTKAHASQDAPNDLYAMQCIDGQCYYATGKKVPEDVLKKFEKHLADEMAKLEQEEGESREE